MSTCVVHVAELKLEEPAGKGQMGNPRQKYKQLNKAAGRCITCGAKRNRSKVYCDRHLDMAVAYKRAKYGHKERVKYDWNQ